MIRGIFLNISVIQAKKFCHSFSLYINKGFSDTVFVFIAFKMCKYNLLSLKSICDKTQAGVYIGIFDSTYVPDMEIVIGNIIVQRDITSISTGNNNVKLLCNCFKEKNIVLCYSFEPNEDKSSIINCIIFAFLFLRGTDRKILLMCF